MLQEHWNEIAFYTDIPLNIDADRYRELDHAGVLRIYVARVGGELVGYAVFLVTTHPHYATSLCANSDVIFVRPDWRNSRIAVNLIRFSEEQLHLEGVQCLYQHTKAAHPTLARILERHGYELIDHIYGKRLDR